MVIVINEITYVYPRDLSEDPPNSFRRMGLYRYHAISYQEHQEGKRRESVLGEP